MPSLRELPYEGRGALPFGVRDRYFDVDIGAQGSEFASLAAHFVEIVGEDFQGEGAIGHLGKDVARKGLVIGDAHLPHEGGIGGEALNQGVFVQVENAALVGAVGENLDFQLGCVHALSHPASRPP